jgi:hypothetical protein
MIEELITLGKMYLKNKSIFPGKGDNIQIGGKIKSLAQASNEATYYFPVVASESLTPDENVMIMRALERVYALFTRTAFSLVPAIKVSNINIANVQDYLHQFHTNIGAKTPFGVNIRLEATTDQINYGILNEANAAGNFKKKMDNFADNVTSSTDTGNIGAYKIKHDYTYDDEGKGTVDKTEKAQKYVSSFQSINKGAVLGDVDWKKANDLIPTIVNVPVRFIEEQNNVIKTEYTVEISVNVKATMHRAPAETLIQDIMKSIHQGRGFLNFVKYFSGEEKSTADFMFGISNMKEDLMNRKSNPWLEAFKRRKRLSDLAWGTLIDNFKPIGTICLTMNEVNVLKNKYDIDIFKEAEKIIKQYFLLGFMIVDQVNELIYVQYDSQPGFQEYPYRTLEREGSNQDRTLRDMIKAMGNVR